MMAKHAARRHFGKWLWPIFCSILTLSLTSCVSKGGIYGSDFQHIVHQAQKKVYPSLVFIRVIQRDLSSGREKNEDACGSGVIISSDGELLTNHHVIDNASEIRCLLNDGRHFSAEVIASDKDLDLALLKLKFTDESTQVPFARIYDGIATEGDFVMAMGAPLGLAKSISIGIISCAKRIVPRNDKQYNTWYQTDAAILPGNSGGPLINTNGEVIGLNTLGYLLGGLGFTLPSNVILEILPRLRQYHSANWSWFGLNLQPLNDFDKDTYFNKPFGVIVSGTEPGSPARHAGILTNDCLIAVNGERVTAKFQEDIPDLMRKISLLPLDKTAKFQIERDGKIIDFEIMPREKGKTEGSERNFANWGVTAKEINQFDNPMLHFYAPEGGVYISGAPESYRYTSSANLHTNDIIVSVDDAPVRTLDELSAAYDTCIEKHGKTGKVPLSVIRGGREIQIIFFYQKDEDEE